MPCNMMSDITAGEVAAMAAGRAAGEASKDADEALRRVAELEQALCGLCQMIATDAEEVPMHPQLLAWFEKHKATPGCSVQK